MRTSKLRFLVVTAAAMMTAAGLAQAQSADQSTKAAATPPAQSAAASATKTAAAAKPAATQSAAAAAKPSSADSDAKLVRDARNAGFKPETIRGTQMFCRTAVELGSNFPVRTCYDSDDVKIKIHEYQVQRDQLEQMHNTGMYTH